MLLSFLVVAGAYLLGAIPFALVVARALRLPDPRSYGSGNAGATNVARGGSKTAAILTLLADGGKGALAVAAAEWTGAPAAAAAGAGAAAVFGHVFSVFIRFRGGRGVATALGVFLCWQPLIGAAALLMWAAAFAVWRYSSVASLSAVPLAALLFALFAPSATAAAAAAVAALIVFRHRDNIARLLRGREHKFSKGG